MNINHSKEPLVSVVVPVYNAANTLIPLIKSLQAQTLTHWECLCINDGSQDHSLRILEKFARTDPRIKIINKKNGGVSSARNHGIDKACGETLFFLDADDTIIPSCLQALYDYLRATQAEWCSCNEIVFHNGVPQAPHRPRKNYTITRDRFISEISQIDTDVCWGKLYDLGWLKRHSLRFRESLCVSEDTFFIYETLRFANKIAHLDTLDGYFYFTSTSGTSLMHTGKSQYPKMFAKMFEITLSEYDLNNSFDRFIAQKALFLIHNHTSNCIKKHTLTSIVFPEHFSLKSWQVASTHPKMFISWTILFFLSFFLKTKNTSY